MADNPFVHVELMTPDLAKAKAFYGALFDWDLEDMHGGSYTMVGVGEHEYGVGGGMMALPSPEVPPKWLAYVSVADVGAATKKATSLGATVLKDVSKVEGYGSFSIVQDPTGAVFGLWQTEHQENA